MKYEIKEKIVNWLTEYCEDSKSSGFVIGVSGGVDSALTSTLCAITGKKVVVVSMPIYQEREQFSRSQKHMNWLCNKFSNVTQKTVDLTQTFESFLKDSKCESELAAANARSRLRMMALYSIANAGNLLVAGTGNKVEDYGVGFFTKYGDGGVDVSPIADLLKSQVQLMAKDLGVLKEIVNATPTDGLWGDNRSDEQQLGASYKELEWALQYYDKHKTNTTNLTERQKEVLVLYKKRHLSNKHKLMTPPVCYIA